MKNHKKIRRIFEQDIAPMTGTTPMITDQPSLPAPGETVADPMTMTVQDFLAKCKSIDPLVCMGIETFIQKNSAALGQTAMPTAPAMTATEEPAQDLAFSTQVPPSGIAAPTPAQPFSLDQSPENLNFPTA